MKMFFRLATASVLSLGAMASPTSAQNSPVRLEVGRTYCAPDRPCTFAQGLALARSRRVALSIGGGVYAECVDLQPGDELVATSAVQIDCADQSRADIEIHRPANSIPSGPISVRLNGGRWADMTIGVHGPQLHLVVAPYYQFDGADPDIPSLSNVTVVAGEGASIQFEGTPVRADWQGPQSEIVRSALRVNGGGATSSVEVRRARLVDTFLAARDAGLLLNDSIMVRSSAWQESVTGPTAPTGLAIRAVRWEESSSIFQIGDSDHLLRADNGWSRASWTCATNNPRFETLASRDPTTNAVSARAYRACDGATFSVPPLPVCTSNPERCWNGVDDDCDGSVDEEDCSGCRPSGFSGGTHFLATPGNVHNWQRTDNTIYALAENGLVVLRVDEGQAEVVTTSSVVRSSWLNSSMALGPRRLFVTHGDMGNHGSVSVVDISSTPRLLSTIPTSGNPMAVAAIGSLLFVGGGDGVVGYQLGDDGEALLVVPANLFDTETNTQLRHVSSLVSTGARLFSMDVQGTVRAYDLDSSLEVSRVEFRGSGQDVLPPRGLPPIAPLGFGVRTRDAFHLPTVRPDAYQWVDTWNDHPLAAFMRMSPARAIGASSGSTALVHVSSAPPSITLVSSLDGLVRELATWRPDASLGTPIVVEEVALATVSRNRVAWTRLRCD